MITLGPAAIAVLILLVIGLIGVAHAIGWSGGWVKRGQLADDFERMIRPLERGLGFARARAGWASSERVEAEPKTVLLS